MSEPIVFISHFLEAQYAAGFLRPGALAAS